MEVAEWLDDQSPYLFCNVHSLFYSPNACEPALFETALYETACIECPLFGCARMSLIWVLYLSLFRRYLGIAGAIFVAIFR